MKVTQTASYALPPNEIMAIIADTEFQDEKCRATYALDYETSVTDGGGRTVVETERALPTEHLPDIAKGFIGNRLVIHEAQTWSGPDAGGRYTAHLTLHVQGAPITGSGTRRLAPDGEGSHDEIRLELKAAIPLIGRRIEEAAAPAVKAAAEIETELLTARAKA